MNLQKKISKFTNFSYTKVQINGICCIFHFRSGIDYCVLLLHLFYTISCTDEEYILYFLNQSLTESEIRSSLTLPTPPHTHTQGVTELYANLKGKFKKYKSQYIQQLLTKFKNDWERLAVTERRVQSNDYFPILWIKRSKCTNSTVFFHSWLFFNVIFNNFTTVCQSRHFEIQSLHSAIFLIGQS